MTNSDDLQLSYFITIALIAFLVVTFRVMVELNLSTVLGKAVFGINPAFATQLLSL